MTEEIAGLKHFRCMCGDRGNSSLTLLRRCIAPHSPPLDTLYPRPIVATNIWPNGHNAAHSSPGPLNAAPETPNDLKSHLREGPRKAKLYCGQSIRSAYPDPTFPWILYQLECHWSLQEAYQHRLPMGPQPPFRHPSLWQRCPPWSAGGSLLCYFYGLQGCSCFTVAFTTGCSGISAQFPGKPPPSLSSLILVLAEFSFHMLSVQNYICT